MADEHVFGTVVGVLMLIIYTCLYLFYIPKFYENRDEYPIKARQPMLVLVGSAIMYSFVVILCFQRMYSENFPCILNIWVTNIGVMVVCFVYLWRCWVLYFKFKTAEAKIQSRHDFNETKSFFLKKQYLISGPFLVRLFGTLSMLVLTPAAFYTREKYHDLKDCAGKDMEDEYPKYVLMAFAFVCFLAFSTFAIFLLRDVNDSFYIRLELQRTGISCCILIVWVLFFIVKPLAEVNQTVPVTTICVFILSICVFIFSIIQPLKRVRITTHTNREVKTLKDVLTNPESVDALELFLKKEFSVENILFWEDVLRYKLICKRKSVDEQKKRANDLYCKYIDDDGDCQVNLIHKTKISIKSFLSERANNFAPPELLKQQTTLDAVRNIAHSTRTDLILRAEICAEAGAYIDEVCVEDNKGGSPQRMLDEEMDGPGSCFDNAASEVYLLIKTDSLQRFLSSEEFMRFQQKQKDNAVVDNELCST